MWNRYAKTAFHALVAAGVSGLTAITAQAIELDTDDWEQLSKGQVLVDTQTIEGRRRVEAAVLIAQQPEGIWDVMLDCDAAPEFVPSMQRCTVLEQFPEDTSVEPEWQIIEHEVKYGWLAPKTVYQFKADYKTNQHISFSRISGDLNELEGDWQLLSIEPGEQGAPEDIDGFTLVTYSVLSLIHI